jgi:hypothetical protein
MRSPRRKSALRARKPSQIWLFAVPRLAPARFDRVPRVVQKQRVQTVAAREETHHARKKHVHVAVKDATRRVRMTNADAARRLAAKDARRLAATDARRPVAKDARRLAAKDARRLAAKDAQRLAAKVALLPVTKVVLLHATKVAQHRVARAALEHGWKRPLVVAVTHSRLLRVVDQPSHRVHRDR